MTRSRRNSATKSTKKKGQGESQGRGQHAHVTHVTKGSLGYLSSMYFSTSLVLGEVAAPFPQIENWESRTET